jgi:hypothetical protein
VSNVTRRPVFGSVRRTVPRSTATLRISGRPARTASTMMRSAATPPTVAVAIASAAIVTLVCFGGSRRRAGRDGVGAQTVFSGHPSRASFRNPDGVARHRQRRVLDRPIDGLPG